MLRSIFICCIAGTLLLASCSDLIVSEIKAQPCELTPLQRVTLSVDTKGSSDITFKWFLVGDGKLIGATNASHITYEAPSNGGSAKIKIEVRDNNQLVTKDVECKTTAPTATATRTPLPSPTATLIATATRTMAPLPTFTPTRTATFTLTPTTVSETLYIITPYPSTNFNCAQGALCIVRVTVQWIPPERRAGRNLYIMVRPYPGVIGHFYFVQDYPIHTSQGIWQVNTVYIGAAGDLPGTPFRVCASVTTQTFTNGQSLTDLPSGERHCVDVYR